MVNKSASHAITHPSAVVGFLFLSIVLFFIVIFRVWRGNFLPEGISPDQLHHLRFIIYTFCFGGIGGTIYSLYGVVKYTSKAKFDKNYFYAHLGRGPVGATLGVIFYFLMQGGLLILADQNVQNSFQSKSLLIGGAFLAGFSTNQFIQKLQDLSRAIWGVKSSKEQETSKS